jgi:hypothetical protein
MKTSALLFQDQPLLCDKDDYDPDSRTMFTVLFCITLFVTFLGVYNVLLMYNARRL